MSSPVVVEAEHMAAEADAMNIVDVLILAADTIDALAPWSDRKVQSRWHAAAGLLLIILITPLLLAAAVGWWLKACWRCVVLGRDKP